MRQLRNSELYIPIWSYSNVRLCLCLILQSKSLHSNLVIFQLIPYLITCTLQDLYIPIWSYSNQNFVNSNDPLLDLYIPIWSYSNYEQYHNLGVNGVTLHSNLVIFQSSCYNTIYLQTLKAAFCRPSFFNPSYCNIFCELFLLSLFRPLLQ